MAVVNGYITFDEFDSYLAAAQLGFGDIFHDIQFRFNQQALGMFNAAAP